MSPSLDFIDTNDSYPITSVVIDIVPLCPYFNENELAELGL